MTSWHWSEYYKEKFGFPIDVQSIILWHAVSRTAKASVFLTNKKRLIFRATSPLILSKPKDNFANGHAGGYFFHKVNRDILSIGKRKFHGFSLEESTLRREC